MSLSELSLAFYKVGGNGWLGRKNHKKVSAIKTKEKVAENDFKKAFFNMMKETLQKFLNY
jgi:hypothetical protein